MQEARDPFQGNDNGGPDCSYGKPYRRGAPRKEGEEERARHNPAGQSVTALFVSVRTRIQDVDKPDLNTSSSVRCSLGSTLSLGTISNISWQRQGCPHPSKLQSNV